jgi:hypothetical protein
LTQLALTNSSIDYRYGRRKKEEGRRKKEEGRKKKESHSTEFILSVVEGLRTQNDIIQFKTVTDVEVQ